MIHELKTWPSPFEAVASGLKTHELRVADRPYKPGDILNLREWIPFDMWNQEKFYGYTGRQIFVEVTYISDPGQWGLPGPYTTYGRFPEDTNEHPGLCCMSVRLLSQESIALILGAEKANQK